MSPDCQTAPSATNSWRDRLAALRNVGTFLGMLWQVSPVLVVSTIMIRLARSFLPLAVLWVSKLIMDGVVKYLQRGSISSTYLKNLVLLELGLAVAGEVMSRINALLDTLLGDHFTTRVGMRLMQHAAELDLAAFEDPAFQDKLERARRHASARPTLLAALLNICQDTLTALLLSSGLIAFSPWLLLLMVAAVIPAFLGEAHFTRMSYSLFYRRSSERRQANYLCFLGASPQSAKEVKVFGLGGHLAERYQCMSEKIVAENKAVAIKKTVVGCMLSLVSNAGHYGVYALVLVRTIAGRTSVGSFLFLTRAFSRSRSCVERILSNFDDVSEQAVSFQDLFDLFNLKPSIRSEPAAVPGPRPIRSGFEFQNVSFAYPGESRVILRELNLRLFPKETLALIGENGTGKTTLVKLLTRLYDPTEGRILLDGIDLREYDLAGLRQEISVIFQDAIRFDLSVRDNIGFGRVEFLADQAQIEEAAVKSLAKRVVDRLPKGYDQILGRRFEGGMELSGGEWQKMALARAYMRDAQLLILDEPTAALDARAEQEVFRRFAELIHGRMALLISHRFSTVRMTDRILVLSGGRIEEQGTHEQLISSSGRYAKLFNLQAAGYR